MDKKNFCVYPSDHAIEKRWRIIWQTEDLLTGKRTPHHAYGNINRFKTVEERLIAAERLIEKIKLGDQPRKKQIDFTPLRVQLEEMLLLRSVNLTPKTARTYKHVINHFLAYAQSEKQWSPAHYILHLKESPLKKHLKESHRSATTINFYRCTLRTLFDDLMHAGKIDQNPFAKLPKIKERRGHGKFFDDAQLATVKTAILDTDPALWLVCQYLFYTFVRPNELFAIRVRDVSLSRGTITIESANSKVAKQRVITIPESLAKILLQLNLAQYPGDYFLVGRKDAKPGVIPADKNRFYRPHHKILEALGFGKGYYLYSWKHTGNYFADRNGVSLKQIQIHNGHSTLKTTDNYMQHITSQHCDQIRTLMPVI